MRALVGRFAAMGIELTGGGLGGAVVGKPGRIAAATFDAQGRPTQTIGDDASGVTIEIGYLA